MHAETLTGFGLTKNESVVYLALLRLGESKVSMIIKSAGFRSGKIYEVLDSLAGKGLVSHVIRNNVRHYLAQNPKKLQEYIKRQKLELEVREHKFRNVLPELSKLYGNNKDSCSVKVYDGVEGIRTALSLFMDRLKSDSKVYLYGANDDPKRDIVLTWRDYDDLCAERNIKTEIIMTAITPDGRERRQRAKHRLKTYRFLKGTDVSNFMVCGNMLLLFNFAQPNCILIENPEYAKQFSHLFAVLWSVSERL